MEIITNHPIITLIIAIISVVGIGFAIRIRIRRGSNYVNQKGNSAEGNISGRDTNITNSNDNGK